MDDIMDDWERKAKRTAMFAKHPFAEARVISEGCDELDKMQIVGVNFASQEVLLRDFNWYGCDEIELVIELEELETIEEEKWPIKHNENIVASSDDVLLVDGVIVVVSPVVYAQLMDCMKAYEDVLGMYGQIASLQKNIDAILSIGYENKYVPEEIECNIAYNLEQATITYSFKNKK